MRTARGVTRATTAPATDRTAPVAGPAGRAALVLWVALVVLTAARAAGAFLPGMALWGFDLQRFLAPAWAWGPWLLAALALVPALARPLTPLVSRAGEAAAAARGARRWGVTLAWMSLAAGLVLLLPDRLRFVGDFLLRQGAVEEAGQAGLLFPQALPLDVLLHVTLPSALVHAGPLGANGVARALGAIEAALLAALALAFVRALRLRGAAAGAAAALVLCGGYLGLYTGYSKAVNEMTILLVAAAVAALRAVRGERTLLPLGVVLALAALLHRSALGLVPGAALAGGLVVRARPAARREPATWLALALPLAALAVTFPHMLQTFAHGDAPVHFAPSEVRAGGGLVRSMFSVARLLDLANLVNVLSPLALGLPFLALALGRGLPRDREAGLLLALTLPFLGLLAFVHPAQGMFRDWDTFAESGMALSLLAAWLAGHVLRGAPRHAWLALGVSLAAALPTAQWLAHQHDLDRGLARVRAFLAGPPARGPEVRGRTWDWLGSREFRLGHWDRAADAFAQAAETQPSARVFTQWAMAETNRGDLAGARDVYRRALDKDPASGTAWLGLAAVSSRLGDLQESRRALQELLRLEPANAGAREMLRRIDQVLAQPPGAGAR